MLIEKNKTLFTIYAHEDKYEEMKEWINQRGNYVSIAGGIVGWLSPDMEKEFLTEFMK